MKYVMTLLLLLILAATSFLTGCGSTIEQQRTATVDLTWDAPTQNADGSTLIDIAGYRVNFGEISLNYTNWAMVFGTATTASIDNLRYDRTIYFAVAAFNIYGYTSSYSGEFQITLPAGTN